MKKIVVASHKGGTAKTSSLLHLAAALTLYHKKKCLLVDSDSQGNLSMSLGFDLDDHDSLPGVLRGEKQLSEVIKTTSIKGLDLVIGNSHLNMIESMPPLLTDAYSHERLRKALSEVEDQYDYCFIDVPSALGWLCSSACYASDYAFVATTPEPFSVLAMDQLSGFFESVQKNHDLQVFGVLFSMWDKRGSTNEAAEEAINTYFPGLIFNSKIRRDKAVSDAVYQSAPVFKTKWRSRAGEDYKALAKEVLARLKKMEKANSKKVVNV